MKIVVLDGYTLNPGDLSWEKLQELGQVTIYDRTEEDKVEERIENADIILTNKVPFNRERLEKCKAKYIGVTATGYNIIDTKAAKELGITVTNIPAYGTDSVAQAVFAHILNIATMVETHSDSVKQGDWATSKDWCYWKYPIIELSNKTLGIIGTGKIGTKTAEIGKAFGMKVIATGSGKNKETTAYYNYVKLDELLKKSDIISLHCPLTEKTEKIINHETIQKMKKGAIIINTSRGALIDEEALYEALKTGKISHAGLDVMEKEPPKKDNKLFTLENCHITPHIAWASIEARGRLLNIAVENVKAYLNGEEKNVVS